MFIDVYTFEVGKNVSKNNFTLEKNLYHVQFSLSRFQNITCCVEWNSLTVNDNFKQIDPIDSLSVGKN